MTNETRDKILTDYVWNASGQDVGSFAELMTGFGESDDVVAFRAFELNGLTEETVKGLKEVLNNDDVEHYAQVMAWRDDPSIQVVMDRYDDLGFYCETASDWIMSTIYALWEGDESKEAYKLAVEVLQQTYKNPEWLELTGDLVRFLGDNLTK